jgi:hypothetical protein
MINLINHETRRTLFRVDLSDCWMDDNKPVRFRLRKLQSPIDEDVQAISLIFGFFSIKFGWIANVPISNENQPND